MNTLIFSESKLDAWFPDNFTFMAFLSTIDLVELVPVMEYFCMLVIIYLQNKMCFICFSESILKIKKIAFYFILKALFVLKIFRFLFWLFGHVVKRLDKKDKVNFKFYDIRAWLTGNNCNTHTVFPLIRALSNFETVRCGAN